MIYNKTIRKRNKTERSKIMKKKKIRWRKVIELKTGKSKKVKIYEGRHF